VPLTFESRISFAREDIYIYRLFSEHTVNRLTKSRWFVWKYDMSTRFSPYPHILRCNNSQSSTPRSCTTWWERCHSQLHAVLYGKNVLVLTHMLYDVVRNWHFHFQAFSNPSAQISLELPVCIMCLLLYYEHTLENKGTIRNHFVIKLGTLKKVTW
jgi:hypothetical protein